MKINKHLNTVIVGDALEVLKTFPDRSVQMCVTSPPYFGLRDYGTETWEGGDPKCEHKPKNRQGKSGDRSDRIFTAGRIYKEFCLKCGALRIDQQMGLEDTPDKFIEGMAKVFREVRRVLRDDGSLWINIGDSYNSAGRKGHGSREGFKQGTNRARSAGQDNNRPNCPNLKPKDMIGIPWMLAFALRADGWFLRQDIIWNKKNPMPESVRDRCTKAHEYIFLLSKSEKYFFDSEAIKEPVSGTAHARCSGVNPKSKANETGSKQNESFSAAVTGLVEMRNKRSVWTVSSHSFKEAHFATFPPKLIEPCILAGTSEKGCCNSCGAPIVRIVKATGGTIGKSWSSHENVLKKRDPTSQKMKDKNYRKETSGWEPSCKCGSPTRQCIVLDPFMGAGTTGLVAAQHSRDFIGIELNPEYAEIATKRIAPELDQWKMFL